MRRRMRYGMLASADILSKGNLFALLEAQNESFTWKLYMWDLPRGVLKLAVNSSIDMLPTFTSLRR
jgi:hypothetical protein